MAGNSRAEFIHHRRTYADGNHIHGSSGGDGLFAGGGAAGGRTDFRASVPPAVRPTEGGDEVRAEALRRKENDNAGVEVFAVDRGPGDDRCGGWHPRL